MKISYYTTKSRKKKTALCRRQICIWERESERENTQDWRALAAILYIIHSHMTVTFKKRFIYNSLYVYMTTGAYKRPNTSDPSGTRAVPQTCVLGTQLQCYARAVCTLNCWTIQQSLSHSCRNHINLFAIIELLNTFQGPTFIPNLIANVHEFQY